MIPPNIALVSDVEGHPPADVARVAAALQRQATRDLAPIWNVSATVDAFPALEDVPTGYWPMIVRDDIGAPGAGGFHDDKDGQPFALIRMSDSWSLTASHELCEMLVDPSGNRTVPGPSPKADQGRVAFLVEVADPCEGEQFAYTINDTLVSDFYTPHFFDPVQAPGVRYDFTGGLTAPRKIEPDGYLSWQDAASGHWWQERWFGTPEPTIEELGPFDASKGSVRAWIDGTLDHPGIDHGLPPSSEALQAANGRFAASTPNARARAAALREEIEELKRGG